MSQVLILKPYKSNGCLSGKSHLLRYACPKITHLRVVNSVFSGFTGLVNETSLEL
jgi:hypothetical protein